MQKIWNLGSAFIEGYQIPPGSRLCSGFERDCISLPISMSLVDQFIVIYSSCVVSSSLDLIRTRSSSVQVRVLSESFPFFGAIIHLFTGLSRNISFIAQDLPRPTYLSRLRIALIKAQLPRSRIPLPRPIHLQVKDHN